jgi:glycosyltransferase involved in cell wall biosynthesis
MSHRHRDRDVSDDANPPGSDAGIVRPLPVALVTRSLSVGGAQRHIVKLCQTVSRSDAELTVVQLVRDEPQDLRADVPDHVSVLTSPFPRHHPRVVPWLAGLVRERGVRVVQTFLWIPDAVASLAWPLSSSAALVCSERGDRGAGVYHNWRRRLFDCTITFRAATRVCANSEFGRRTLEDLGCAPEKLCMIPNGIDLAVIDRLPAESFRSTLGWPVDAPVVACVARLTHYKGVDTVLEALARIAVPLHCVIVGDGPARSELEALARKLGLAARVAFLGERSRPEAVVKGSDVAVLATRAATEHCSNSVLEAMACARAVVTTRVAGNPELVVHGETGLLVEPDDPPGMAAALGALASDPGRAARLGRAGRARVERFYDMRSVARRFVALWREVGGPG